MALAGQKKKKIKTKKVVTRHKINCVYCDIYIKIYDRCIFKFEQIADKCGPLASTSYYLLVLDNKI